MKTREEIIRILSANKPDLTELYKVRSIALFGSWSRGEQQAGSDVDILIDVDSSIGLKFVALAERIEALLGMKVDLVSKRAIKKKMREDIEQDLIYV